MSTINFSVVISEVNKRFKSQLLTVTDSLADVSLYSKTTLSLARGEEITLSPQKLFAAFSNSVNILIHITVNGNTITIPYQSWILLPFSPDDVVTIKLENPDSPTSLPAVVSYITV